MPIAQLAKRAGIVESTSEALRLIAQRGLKVDGEVVADKGLVIPAGVTVVVRGQTQICACHGHLKVSQTRVSRHPPCVALLEEVVSDPT
jgi:ribosome-associated protein YbcJ (S4-like RNA binding protein)